MNALIKRAAEEIEVSFGCAHAAVQTLGDATLNDLEHECGELEHNPEFTVRTGAHIVRAAVVMTQEERKGK